MPRVKPLKDKAIFVACGICPAYTGFAGNKYGFILQGLYPGHYSNPQANEALAMLDDCEAYGEGGGGHSLLRFENGAWSRIFYHSGFVGECLSVVRKDGRTSLLCERSGGNNGVFSTWFVEAWLEGDDFKKNELFRVYGNDGSTAKAASSISNIQSVKFDKKSENPLVVGVNIEDVKPDMKIQHHHIELVFDGEHFRMSPADAELVR